MAHFRLALATPQFWPLIGDVPNHLLSLAHCLAAADQQITVVSAWWKPSWPRQMSLGSVSLLRLRGAPHSGWGTLRWMYSLSGWLREPAAAEFDGLIVAGLRHEAYVALGALAKSRRPVVLLAGEGDVDWQRTATFGSRIAARCRAARAIVAPSQPIADELAAAGYSRETITIIPRRVAVPPPQSPRLREEARAALAAANYDLVTTGSAPVALAVGRLDKLHRFGDLVRAWRIVTARRPEARLWIVGDGPEREKLYRQIGDLDQRFRVLIPGAFDCCEELLHAADVLLAPGAHAVPPLILLQAQAAGLPVIAADAPALRMHVLPEETGLVYPAGDQKALAAAVLRLFDNPATAVALGSAARQQIQTSPRPNDEAADYLTLLEHLCKE
jgi:glycosyltransferase involved in cell wall biosynthesis